MSEAVQRRSDELKTLCIMDPNIVGNRVVYDSMNCATPTNDNTVCSHYLQRVVCFSSNKGGHHWGGGHGPKTVVKTQSPHSTCAGSGCQCRMDTVEPGIPHNRILWHEEVRPNGHQPANSIHGPDLPAIAINDCEQCFELKQKDNKRNRDRTKRRRQAQGTEDPTAKEAGIGSIQQSNSTERGGYYDPVRDTRR